MNPKVDRFFTMGCGRCPLGGTPQCKVNHWPEELEKLRMIVLDCGLSEVLKWGVPCYLYKKSNVIIIGAFNEYCSLSFFKGALLNDSESILIKPGENTQAARLIKFTNISEIDEIEATIKAYIYEAIEIEKAGLKVKFKKQPEPIPEELQHILDEDPVLMAAFYALTPGRQRGYIIHFSQPKQSKTRISRIEKCRHKILEGKGFNDR